MRRSGSVFFLFEKGASVGADFGLFNFFLLAQESK